MIVIKISPISHYVRVSNDEKHKHASKLRQTKSAWPEKSEEEEIDKKVHHRFHVLYFIKFIRIINKHIIYKIKIFNIINSII